MTIRKIDGKWCLLSKGSGKRLGCHDTREKAIAQERAVQANKRSFFQSDLDDAAGPSRLFLKHLREMLKGSVTEKAFEEAVRKSRARAGGTMSGRKRKRSVEDAKMSTAEIRSADELGSIHVDPGFMMGPRLAKAHDAVKYRKSEVDPEEVRDGTATPYDEQERCGTCRFYRYSRCQLVEGSIEAYDLCDLWDRRIMEFREGVSNELVDACDELSGPCRLLFELIEATDAKSWIPYLPKPGTYRHQKWGDIVLTQERNRHFVEQFDKRIYGQNLPIDIEHSIPIDSKGRHVLDGTSVVAGYVTKLRQNSDGSVDAFVEFTQDGAKTISEKSRRYFSPQWLEAWQDPSTKQVHTDVAIGGALTSRPFFKEKHLRPIIASDRGLAMSFTEGQQDEKFVRFTLDKEEGNMSTQKAEGLISRVMKALNFSGSEDEFKDEFRSALAIEANDGGNADDGNVDDGNDPGANADDGSDGGDGNITVSASEFAEFRKLQNENKELRAMSEKSAKEAKSMGERLERIESGDRERRFRDIVKGRDPETGDYDPERVFFGSSDAHVKRLMKFAEVFGDESEEVKEYIQEQQVGAVQRSKSMLFAEIGDERGRPHGGSAYHQIEAKAKELVKDGKAKSFSEALAMAEDNNPDLAKKYLEEMRGGR